MLGLALGLCLLAVSVAACGISTTPFNPAQSCQAVGGIPTSDGRCNMVLP